MKYGYSKQVDHSFDEAVFKVKEALKKEGFGVLTEIDVKATLKKKLDVEFENYLIIGACNPNFAYKALQSEQEIGLLLPCNVLVYETEGNIFVSAINPSVAMSMIDNKDVTCIADQVEDKLHAVIDVV